MSFETIVTRVSPVLKRITHRLNGHFLFFDEEDLFQEALVHLWQEHQEGRLSDKTDSYILQGCYFYLKNHLRKAREKKTLVSLDEVVSEGGPDLRDVLTAPPQEEPRLRLEADLLMERVSWTGLTEREQEILSLAVDGMTVREIGRKLGISHVRVVKLRNRIRGKCEKLRTELEVKS